LHPSKAVKELQEIKERAEIILENTEKIFEETYQLKYLEFKQYLSKLQRPEDFTKDFCDNLKVTMLDKF
jgi:transcription initiation factor TFIIIB Brf1 subunit/transcription initiation factor TFIIB